MINNWFHADNKETFFYEEILPYPSSFHLGEHPSICHSAQSTLTHFRLVSRKAFQFDTRFRLHYEGELHIQPRPTFYRTFSPAQLITSPSGPDWSYMKFQGIRFVSFFRNWPFLAPHASPTAETIARTKWVRRKWKECNKKGRHTYIFFAILTWCFRESPQLLSLASVLIFQNDWGALNYLMSGAGWRTQANSHTP